MDVTIELAKTEAGLEEVVALDKVLDEEMKPLLPGFFDAGSFVRRYDGYLDGTRGFVLVAREGGVVLGMARCALGAVAMLESLVVAEEYRGQGVGSALLGAAREEAKARGHNVMMLNVLSGNDGARRLYERAGFAEFRASMILEL